jgi:hypothetical protein
VSEQKKQEWLVATTKADLVKSKQELDHAIRDLAKYEKAIKDNMESIKGQNAKLEKLKSFTSNIPE